MWLSSLWSSRNRLSLDELRYQTEQLLKLQVVNELNKAFVVEALRSIAELVTYGDQHDPSYFEYFMEKQLTSEFSRILRITSAPEVQLQLLQSMSIMIENLTNEVAIYYLFSNGHINHLINYSFDFSDDELLSYYISFLRAISGKLNKNTISLLVKTQDEDVVSFPLYVQAIHFAFHEENMIRAAVRALTLSVYHVGDESVNKFVSRSPQSGYFSEIVRYFRKKCVSLDAITSPACRKKDCCIATAVEEVEDSLYYFSDVVSAGVPELERMLTDKILKLLVFPLLLPSLNKQSHYGVQIRINTSLYLLCCILSNFKSKELAKTIAVSLSCPLEAFAPDRSVSEEPCINIGRSDVTSRELLLSYIAVGDEQQVLGSLSLLATLLQTQELDESVLDGLRILPRRKQKKKLLLQALVGEDAGEERLFSSNNTKDDTTADFDKYMLKLKDHYGLSFRPQKPESDHEYLVLDALVTLFCRFDVPAEILWLGGWLLRQLFRCGDKELFTTVQLKSLEDSHSISCSKLFKEVKGSWSDSLISILNEEWQNCRRAIEASSPPKDLKSLLLPSEVSSSEVESICEIVKVFALQSELLLFSCGGSIHDLSPLDVPLDSTVYGCSKSPVFSFVVLKLRSDTEVNIL